MAARVHLTFDNGGEPVDVELRMSLMVQAERHFKGEIPAIEGTLWACWKKLAPGAPFDVWLDSVDTFDNVDGGEDAPSPLVEEPEPGS